MSSSCAQPLAEPPAGGQTQKVTDDCWQRAQGRVRTLERDQLRRAVPLLTDLGVTTCQIRELLHEDLRVLREHHVRHGRLPNIIGGPHGPRIARLRDAGIRIGH